MEVNEGNSLDKIPYEEQVSKGALTKLASLMLGAM